jgi:hypothetical protein
MNMFTWNQLRIRWTSHMYLWLEIYIWKRNVFEFIETRCRTANHSFSFAPWFDRRSLTYIEGEGVGEGEGESESEGEGEGEDLFSNLSLTLTLTFKRLYADLFAQERYSSIFFSCLVVVYFFYRSNLKVTSSSVHPSSFFSFLFTIDKICWSSALYSVYSLK